MNQNGVRMALVVTGLLCQCAVPITLRAEEAATEKPAPRPRPSMEETMQQMGPAMSSMMEGMMSGTLRFLSRPETADTFATFAKNFYDALIKKGFTEDQAIKIVAAVGIPSLHR